MDAGKRGATALEPSDLLEAIINEDQGKLARRFAGSVTRSGTMREPEPFFSTEVATQVLLGLNKILPQHEPIAVSVDMAMSANLEGILNTATSLAKELQHSEVQPLHLVAAILAEENSRPAEILKEAGISRDTVIRALRG